jgi:hypothetical protein
MHRLSRSSSFVLRGGIAVALVFTSLLAGCDRPRDTTATGASPPASAASR